MRIERAGAVALVAAAASVGILVLAPGKAGKAPSPAGRAGAPTPTRTPAPAPASASPTFRRGWTALPATPIAREWAVSLRTGGEVFLWGGSSDYGGRLHTGGLTFRDGSDRWRNVPPWPWGPREQAVAVWTGEEVLVWSGAGAAYDPLGRRWRKLAPGPLGRRQPAAAVWTGEEMLLWGASSYGSRARDGAALDPVTHRWRSLARAPLALTDATAAWTGKEMIVLGARLDGNNRSTVPRARGMAYDPASDRWRMIAPFGLSPQASSVAWDGRELLAWDYELRAGSYDPERNRWRALPRLPLRFGECYPETARVGRRLLAWYCGSGALYDRESRTWTPTGRAPRTVGGPPLGAGRAVLFPPASDRATAFWAYRPGTR